MPLEEGETKAGLFAVQLDILSNTSIKRIRILLPKRDYTLIKNCKA